MTGAVDHSKGGLEHEKEDRTGPNQPGTREAGRSANTEPRRPRAEAVTEDRALGASSGAFGLADFGRNLRRLRLERKLTQETLAETANVSPRYVALIEAGARNPTLGVVLDLAAALQVPPYKLFKPAS